MKLAEALLARADLQNRLLSLKERLRNNAKMQEGDQPAEDPNELLKEMNQCLPELETLIRRINLTNCQAQVDGQSLTALLAQRDVLHLRLSILRHFLSEASNKVSRYSKMEIRIHSTVDVREMQKQVDQFAKELRLLDIKIQEANWTVALIEEEQER